MLRKVFFFVCLLALLVLAGGAQPALAKEPAPAWQPAVETLGSDNIYFTWAIQTFQGRLYAAVGRYDWMAGRWAGVEVYRSADGSSWETVLTNGGGDPDFFVSWDMAVFNDQLYIAMNDWGWGTKPAKIMRTANGVDWETVFLAGPEVMNGSLIDKLGVFDGMIYATTAFSNGQIWRSPTGGPGTWQMVAALGAGDWSSLSPVAYQGHLYVAGTQGELGLPGKVSLWRSADGITWDVVGEGVLDDPANGIERDLVAFNGALYFSVNNFVDGGRIYRSKDGVTWELAADQGFGNPYRSEFVDLTVYQGELYVTANESYEGSTAVSVWSSHTGDPGSWQQVGELIPYAYAERGDTRIFKGELYLANMFPFNTNVTIYKLVK